jgi:hypothetical protein
MIDCLVVAQNLPWRTRFISRPIILYYRIICFEIRMPQVVLKFIFWYFQTRMYANTKEY